MTILAVKNIISNAQELLHPTPDMSLLRSHRKRPPKFPREVLGTELYEWLTRTAISTGSPVDYVAGALFSACSALIGNSRRVSPWKGWDEPSSLWIGLVGEPSSNKSPAIDPVINILRKLEDELAEGFELQIREWETKKEVAICAYEQWKNDVSKAKKNNIRIPIKPEEADISEEPVRPRFIGNDTSVEKLGLLLASHDKGLLFYRDELTGWLGSFDKYNGNGQDADRAFWTESYGGRPYVIDRVKHQKPTRISHLLVSIMGGIQPDKLSKLIKGADDGFTARFLWCWPDPIAPFRPDVIAEDSILVNALRKLSKLSLENNHKNEKSPRVLFLSDEAADKFQKWREEHFVNEQDTYGPLKSAYGKAPGHVLRLALLLELIWWAIKAEIVTNENNEPLSVSAKAIGASICLINNYFKPMAERVFSDASVTEEELNASTLAKYIVKNKLKMINLRQVRREAHLQGLSKAEKMQKAAESLVEANWLFEPEYSSAPGRPRGDYVVNPRIWEFSE